MLGLHGNVISALRRGLERAQRELSLLEQDLGLCARCGEQPPPPLRQYALRPLPAQASMPAMGGRRVA